MSLHPAWHVEPPECIRYLRIIAEEINLKTRFNPPDTLWVYGIHNTLTLELICDGIKVEYYLFHREPPLINHDSTDPTDDSLITSYGESLLFCGEICLTSPNSINEIISWMRKTCD